MEEKEAREFIQSKETPLYLFDIRQLNYRMSLIKKRINKEVKLCYAVKANPFLIPDIDKFVDRFEVCSAGELKICENYCINPEKIVFSGVNKTLNDIKLAYEYGVKLYTAESINHLELINEFAKTENVELPVLLRLNANSQFGMSIEDLERIVSNYKKYPGIKIEGIHYFKGTMRRNKNEMQKEINNLLEIVDRISKKNEFSINELEYGPGLAVPYFEGEDFSAGIGLLENIIPKISEASKKIDMTIELGRYFVANCGYYFTKVCDTKLVSNLNYAILDGGIHQINYFGQVLGMKVPRFTNLSLKDNTNLGEWCICGSLCSTSDVIIRRTYIPRLNRGDVLMFENVGAYSMMEGICLLLSRDLPAVYKYYDKGKIIMEREFINTYTINMRRN